MSIRCKAVLTVLIPALFILLATLRVQAQLDRGSITGTVTDASGAVVPGAQVTVVSVATGIAMQATTGVTGEYTVRSLIANAYTVTGERTGFEKTLLPTVQVGVNQVVRLDLVLKPGSTSQTVEVSAGAPLLSTETSSLGTLETEQRITDLPLNGRNFIQLAYLGPGANLGYANTGANRGTTDNARPGVAIAVNGLQSFDNSFLLDGVDNNEWGQGTLVVQPAPDAIREFSVEENSMKAQFGRGGAAVNVVLRSGTNNFHGSAYEFIRNTVFDAENYFASGRPEFHMNQFGGSFGGPIRKDRTFFFGDYQGERMTEGLTFLSTVPTAAEHNGDFTALQTPLYDPYTTSSTTDSRQLLNPSNPYVIPTGRINSVGQNLVNVLPLPNLPGLVNNFRYEPTETDNDDQFDVRLDHTISSRDQLFAHAAYQYPRITKPAPLGSAGGCCQGYGSVIPTRSQNYAVGWDHVLSSTMLNSARVAFIRWTDNAQHLDAGTDRANQLGIPNADRGGASSGLSLVSVSGYTEFGDSQYVPEIATDNTYQIADQLSWVTGKHSLMVGGDYRYYTRDFYQAQAPFGYFTFSGQYTQNLATGDGGNAIADILLGLPVQNLQDGLSQMDTTNIQEFDLFAQDDWHILPNLILNLGLRYDLTSPVGGRVGNFNLAKGYVENNFGPEAVPNAGVAYDKDDWGPRVGLAWTPFGNKRMVIHAAGGIFYSPEGNVFNDLGENPPTLEFYNNILNPANIPSAQNLLSAGFPSELPSINPAAPTGEVKTSGSKRLIPKIIEWNAGIQQDLTHNWVFNLAYVGTHAYREWASESFNLDQPEQPLDSNFGPSPNYGRPYNNNLPGLNTIYPIDFPVFTLVYNSLETKLEKHFSQGFNVLFSYTYSHNIGTAEGDPGGGQGAVQNPYNIQEERGNVAPDFRHYFVTSYLYDLPFGRGQRFGADVNRFVNMAVAGWEVSGITTARTGEHFTPCLSYDPTNTGTYCAWAERVGNPYDFSYNMVGQTALGCPPGHQSLTCWYNQAAFTIPPLAPGQSFAHQFGNSGNGSLVGPNQINFNFALLKNIPIDERNKVEFRAEVYNLLNHPQFALPSNNPDAQGGASITATLPDNQREFQFALKWLF